MPPRKLFWCDLVLNPQLETMHAEKSMLGLFPQSIWHFMVTVHSTYMVSSTARRWLVWGDDTRVCLAGDLEFSDFFHFSDWAPVQSEMPRTHWESLEACPLELVWKVAESNSHLMSRAPSMPSLLGSVSWCQNSIPQRASSHQHLHGDLRGACRDADRGLHPIPSTRIPGGGARTSKFSTAPQVTQV